MMAFVIRFSSDSEMGLWLAEKILRRRGIQIQSIEQIGSF